MILHFTWFGFIFTDRSIEKEEPFRRKKLETQWKPICFSIAGNAGRWSRVWERDVFIDRVAR